MNNNIVYALYDDDDILLNSVKKMKEKNLNVLNLTELDNLN